ncbi:hypothetical protein BJ508DRAFT_312668 [Ascobolus immersus RN42]|uniref:Uncharacterized protein n=1 Tax=Ascobolus immersus RN42 TaxID=1160509 RepID=A0A3N4HN48_ASCIM|nr:hypothetical protein BJ508DRAFT_312668 [Ascobolus immersus RN42]
MNHRRVPDRSSTLRPNDRRLANVTRESAAGENTEHESYSAHSGHSRNASDSSTGTDNSGSSYGFGDIKPLAEASYDPERQGDRYDGDDYRHRTPCQDEDSERSYDSGDSTAAEVGVRARSEESDAGSNVATVQYSDSDTNSLLNGSGSEAGSDGESSNRKEHNADLVGTGREGWTAFDRNKLLHARQDVSIRVHVASSTEREQNPPPYYSPYEGITPGSSVVDNQSVASHDTEPTPSMDKALKKPVLAEGKWPTSLAGGKK